MGHGGPLPRSGIGASSWLIFPRFHNRASHVNSAGYKNPGWSLTFGLSRTVLFANSSGATGDTRTSWERCAERPHSLTLGHEAANSVSALCVASYRRLAGKGSCKVAPKSRSHRALQPQCDTISWTRCDGLPSLAGESLYCVVQAVFASLRRFRDNAVSWGSASRDEAHLLQGVHDELRAGGRRGR
jgi:hypothetical protein